MLIGRYPTVSIVSYSSPYPMKIASASQLISTYRKVNLRFQARRTCAPRARARRSCGTPACGRRWTPRPGTSRRRSARSRTRCSPGRGPPPPSPPSFPTPMTSKKTYLDYYVGFRYLIFALTGSSTEASPTTPSTPPSTEHSKPGLPEFLKHYIHNK